VVVAVAVVVEVHHKDFVVEQQHRLGDLLPQEHFFERPQAQVGVEEDAAN